MHQAAKSYATTAKTALSPRELEAEVLIRAAKSLQAAKENWTGDRGALIDAVELNRRVWTVLVSAMAEPDCPHDTQLRSNIVNLGLFAIKRGLLVLASEKMDELDILISINREIAAGLRGRGTEPQAISA